ncbi:SDR family NAD(P)-dependent oxidoreductase [Mycobacterium sherrisii]|uniref:SDR family NAD(P)-dependent oxidoreductase n=1 Tax=Mycobacterium sherrisii TaxID=243061 RepID=UPI003975C23E
MTGAARAEGLGYAFARQIAVEGVNLIVTDVIGDELERRAAQLRTDFGVEVRTATCDLGEAGPWAALDHAMDGLDVDLLVCNHMFTPKETPPILDMPLEVHHRMLDINARAYTTLVHTIGNRMRERNRGSIVIVASGAGLTSAPFTAAYSANKAFQIALGEALWFELGDTDIDVLVMIGGLMRTQGDALDQYPRWMIAEPAPVVREVLNALGRKHMVIPGLTNRIFTLVQTRVNSRRRTVQTIGRFMAKGLGK